MKSTRTLTRWGLILVDGRGPILAGNEGSHMRTSTPLVEFDAVAGTALTASGRPYRVVGPPHYGNALHVFNSLWDTEGAVVEIVAPEAAAALIKSLGNAPFDFAPEERSRLDAIKVGFLAGEIGRIMRRRRMTADDLAATLLLPLDTLDAILAVDVDRVRADDADDIFVRVCEWDAAHVMSMPADEWSELMDEIGTDLDDDPEPLPPTP